MSKHFGTLKALDDVSVSFPPGGFHALLGENGAGKSTLVKCMLGYYHADAGQMRVDGRPRRIDNPRAAHRLGLGMVYQHFTLVPNMTVAENLVLGLEHMPAVLDWRHWHERLAQFQKDMPFHLDLDRTVTSLAAGEKQKLEILRQLFLNHRFLILDEPTSVLTPAEADQVLGLLREMAEDGRLSVVLITHKLREVEAFARDVTVLRGGRVAGTGAVGELGRDELVRMMIGREHIPAVVQRTEKAKAGEALQIRDLRVFNDKGLPAVRGLTLSVGGGEIVGVAGVSGNGQRELVEVLAGQRPEESGEIRVRGQRYLRSRREMRAHGIYLLSEEPLHNSCVRSMSVAQNLALRNFDEPAHCRWGFLVNRRSLRRQAQALIERYHIKTQGPDVSIDTLSGGNVQRTVLARELSGKVSVLIAQNPCFGLDLSAAAEIRNQILSARNEGAAVLLISEDLDEILELADRIVVMFEGELVYETPRAGADVHVIGHYMTSHAPVGDGANSTREAAS